MQIKKTVSQIALGLAVIGLGTSMSAFTNKEAVKQSSIYRYYNTEGSSNASDRSRYEYHADDDLCTSLPANVCSEEWDFGANAPQPAEGSNPPATATLVVGSQQIGDFNP